MTPTPDLSPTEAAIVARFDAAEPAPESYRPAEPVFAGPGPCDRSPAEQDDERFDTPRADAITAVYRLLVALPRDHASRGANAAQIVDAVVAALAARPSADTETLRRVRALADEWEADSEADYGAGIGSAINRRAAACRLRAALDAR